MGCGASAAAAPEKAAAPAAEQKVDGAKMLETMKKVEANGFTSIFKDPAGHRGGWLSDQKYVYITGDNEAEDHPVFELDIPSLSTKEVSSIKKIGQYIWPSISTSPDGSMYAIACGPEIKVLKADHSDVCTITTPITDGACKMAFSPDGKKIACEGEKNKCWAYSLPDGAELLAIEGEKASEYGMKPVWYDEDTLFCMHCWMVYAHSVSLKKQMTKWELPKGRCVETGVLLTKSKIYFSNDEGGVHEMGFDGETFSIKHTFDRVADTMGPSNMQIFSDEFTIMHEKSGGGHFFVKPLVDVNRPGITMDQVTEMKKGITVKRGEGSEDDLGSIEEVLMNKAETHVALCGFKGLEVFIFAATAPAPVAAAAAEAVVPAAAELPAAEAAPEAAEAAPEVAPLVPLVPVEQSAAEAEEIPGGAVLKDPDAVPTL